MKNDSPTPRLNEVNMETNFTTPPSSVVLVPSKSFPVSSSFISNWKFSNVPDSLKFLDETAKEKYFSIKLFYANLSEDICLKSSVLGEDIILTTVYINTLFDLPNDGARFFSFGKALNNLSIDHFFLHKLIYCTLLFGPTTSGGHTIDINTMSIYLTFMAIHEHPINLGFVILKSIAHSTAYSSKNLPYAMLLTLVFEKENIEPPKERRIIDLNSLSKMRIQHFETYGWYRGIKKVTKADPIEVSSSANSSPRKCTRISPLF
ncbi:hypothetical protein CDL12_12242 [Handroanthus impetiginosus]|uniref:Uncharacterized protein n=1 Tax=Handroanthus impetiginosus TaxID=429701 RepID=A0A2G9HC52_9LAMI|nr:hypothetical protein CDL12_12242 [Handroanthus impetiginosus]